MAKPKTITSQLEEIPRGQSLEIPVDSRSEALSIRALCGMVNKNRSENKLRSVITPTSIIVTNKEIESRTEELRSINPGESRIFEDDNYDAIHATSSHLNKTEGKKLTVKKVIQVKNAEN